MTTLNKNIVAELVALRDENDKTRANGKGYLQYMHNIDGKLATEYLDQVWSRGANAADKSEIIALMIKCKERNESREVIRGAFKEKFDWKPSTTDTLFAYYSYMVEYAKQVNK